MPHKVESPYVGLVPYTEEDAQFFFGRERDQQRILANLFASRLTILYGASGVGKSSVLRAGIVQEVRQRIAESRANGERPEIAVVYFKDWKGDVLASLRVAIGSAMASLLGEDYVADLPASISFEDLLVAAGQRMGGDLLLILDQFEEYFLYHPATAPDEFAVQFAAAANRAGIPANFLISLRDDAISRLDRFKPLIPNLFSNYLRIHHLSGEGARDAILKPVERYNSLPDELKVASGVFAAEPDLVGMVIEQAHRGRVLIGQVGQGKISSDAVGSGVETPYLQLVMTRLWKEEIRLGSHTLRSETLRELGGAETIIKTHLETALAGLTVGERDTCAKLFPHLVTPSGTKIAHTVLNLAKFAKADPDAVRPLLEALAGSDKRILAPVAPPDGQPGELQYEIYHDSLAQAVLTWQARYESDCEAAQRAKEKHRIQIIAATLAIAFLIALGAAAAAVWQYHLATIERAHAKQAEAQAWALKSESDAIRLVKEKAEAEKNHNAELVALLQHQIDSAQSDATKYKQAAATPGAESKAPSVADIVRERDTLRAQLTSVEKRTYKIVGDPGVSGSGSAPAAQEEQVSPAPAAPSAETKAPPPVRVEEFSAHQGPHGYVLKWRVPGASGIRITSPGGKEMLKDGPASGTLTVPIPTEAVKYSLSAQGDSANRLSATVTVLPPRPPTRTLRLTRILCRKDGGRGSTDWSFEIFSSDAAGKLTSIGQVASHSFNDKETVDLDLKFTLRPDTKGIHINGKSGAKIFYAEGTNGVTSNLQSVLVTVQARPPRDGDFEFAFRLE